ncbi:MAG: hypothetical protein JKX70_09475 [Phycisphaerales bacterium]|nr:hypothetical protein [Phycisphaerales bacterium]
MKYTRSLQTRSLGTFLLASLIMLPACSDSDADNTIARPAFEADTDYLDDLAQEQGIETQQADEESIEEPAPRVSNIEAPVEKEYADEEREWVKEGGSKSLLGRSRDKAKTLRDQLQGSTEPEKGLANTIYDEEYAQASGFAWDMPEDWRMAVPSTGRFAEMYIRNQLGNASVAFTKETDSVSQIKRALQFSITDTFTGRSSAKVKTREVKGYKVTSFDLEGTYIDPGAKGTSNGNPFYAIHAVVIELPTTKIMIKLWGPSDTVAQSIGKFDAMIDTMYER